jgi:hypothetical protein
MCRAELRGATAALVTATVPKDLYAVIAADVLGHLDGVLPS